MFMAFIFISKVSVFIFILGMSSGCSLITSAIDGSEIEKDTVSSSEAVPGTTTSEPGVTSALGKTLWTSNCMSCHGEITATDKKNRTYSQLRAAFFSTPSMFEYRYLSATEIKSLVVALSTQPAPPSAPEDINSGTTPPGPAPDAEPAPDTTVPEPTVSAALGKTLWVSNCMSCHGDLATTDKKDRTSTHLRSAFASYSSMFQFRSLSTDKVDSLVLALATKPVTPPPSETPTETPPAPTPTPPPVVENKAFTCVAGADPGVTPIRRLSKLEYINTLEALLKDGYLLGREDRTYANFGVIGKLAPLIEAIPEDDVSNQFSRLDTSLNLTALDGQHIVAQTAANEIANDSGRLQRYAGSCATQAAPTDACLTSFITSFGKKVYRRPLLASEVTELKAIYNTHKSESVRHGFAALFQAFFLAPQFLFIIEDQGTPVAGKSHILKLTDYEIASRLSYMLTQSMPSDSLFAAADAGLLSKDDAKYAQEVDKLFAANPNNMSSGIGKRSHPLMMTPLQRTYMQFYKEWMKIDKTPRPFSTFMSAFMNVYNNNRFNWKNLDTDSDWSPIATEAEDFVFRLTFIENKTFKDLLTDNSALLITDVARNYYQMPSTTPLDQLVTLPGRSGLLTRSPFLTTGTESTNPILRGVQIRRNILCDNLPSPNPDVLPERALDSPEVSPTVTTRERYHAKTSGVSCMGCHSQINALGFAFEDFDSLGRNRGHLFEPIFKLEGSTVKLIASLPVNAKVDSLNITPNDGLKANGGIELSRILSESEKANTCFVRKVYRFTTSRMEQPGDDCMMDKMYSEMKKSGGSILSLMRALPMHPNFKLRNVGK